MSLMNSINYRDFERILFEDGFRLVRVKGGHYVYENEKGQHFVLPKSRKEIKGAIYINYCRTFGRDKKKKKANGKKNKKNK